MYIKRICPLLFDGCTTGLDKGICNFDKQIPAAIVFFQALKKFEKCRMIYLSFSYECTCGYQPIDTSGKQIFAGAPYQFFIAHED